MDYPNRNLLISSRSIEMRSHFEKCDAGELATILLHAEGRMTVGSQSVGCLPLLGLEDGNI